MTQYLDAATREPHPDHHYRTIDRAGGDTIVRCRDCNILLVPDQPARPTGRSNPAPEWFEEAAALAGRELFAQAVSGDTQDDVESTRRLWDRSGPNTRIGGLKPAFTQRGRTVIAMAAAPLVERIQDLEAEVAELRRGRGHYGGPRS